MVFLKTGTGMVINKRSVVVGSTAIANDNSVYKGRIGEVIEIRIDEDKETDNYGPDIYVDFDGEVVIMAEEMLQIL